MIRGLVLVASVVLAGPTSAWAYDPATTHAGLTEKAALASSLHKVLTRRLGRPLGLLEPLQFHFRLLDPAQRKALLTRLGALDPAGGYRPGVDGTATALSWIMAGAVLAETPPERGRHHFLDPSRRAGLRAGDGLSGFAHSVRLAFDGAATLRQIATGTAFDLTGEPSVDWALSPRNELGVPAFVTELERAVSASDPGQREVALVRGLLALGAVTAVLQDAGEPAHVRNDFGGSAYERFVASRWGRIGVPAAATPVKRPTLEGFFTAGDGQGLADRTHRRFFSAGTVPSDVSVVPSDTPRQVVQRARGSLAYELPTLPALELRKPAPRHYVTIDGRRALAYTRDPGRVRFFLDEAVYLDSARSLLPEIGAYSAGFIDHLLRGSVKLEASGRSVTITPEGLKAIAEGAAQVVWEDARGARKALAGGDGLASGAPVTVQAPAAARRIGVVIRGRDAAGPFIAVGELSLD